MSDARAGAGAGRGLLTRLVREVVDGSVRRRHCCGCGCAECVCSDKQVWPGDEGVEVTLEGLCDRLRTTGFGDGSLFLGDGLGDAARERRRRGDVIRRGTGGASLRLRRRCCGAAAGR